MIYFFSGTPGSGKSLHCAKMIDQWVRRRRNIIANFEINDEFWDIKQRNAVRIEWVENESLNVDYLLDFADKYHERDSQGRIKEKQTLLIIDECQTMFNSRSWNARDRSRWVVFFTQHRKFGYEAVLISQSKDLIDRQIRGLFEFDYVHRNIKNFKFMGFLLSRLFGGNFFIVVVQWMANKKRDHVEYLFGMKKYYKLYDSYKIFDKTNLRQLSAMRRDGVGVPDEPQGDNCKAPV